MSNIPLTLLVLASCSASPAWGQDPKDVSRHEGLHSVNAAERDAATEAIIAERRGLIAELREIIENRTVGDRESSRITESAIRLLGQIRAAEAVPVLVDELTFPTPYAENGGPALAIRDALPSVAALIEIGSPSIEPLLSKAEGSDDSVVTTCTAFILDQILGMDAAIAVIDVRIAAEQDPEVSRRLRNIRHRIVKRIGQ